MKAQSSFTIIMFYICSAIWISGGKNAHSASCPDGGAYAGIKIWHYLESTAAPFYTQTTEYEGTVGIWFLYLGGDFFIEMAGNDIIYKTIKAKQETTNPSCTYETAKAKVTVKVSSNSVTCNDGLLNMKIIETAEATSADYHCVASTPSGSVEYGGTNIYPATRLEHDVRLEYVPGVMDVQAFQQGTGDYSWTLLFRERPVPFADGRAFVGILPLLLSE